VRTLPAFLSFFLPDGGSALSGLRGPSDVVGRISVSAIRQSVSGLFSGFLPDGGSALSGLRGPRDVAGRISVSAIRQSVSGLFYVFLPDGGSALSGLRSPSDVVGRISASAIRQSVSGLFYRFFAGWRLRLIRPTRTGRCCRPDKRKRHPANHPYLCITTLLSTGIRGMRSVAAIFEVSA